MGGREKGVGRYMYDGRGEGILLATNISRAN